MIVVDIWRSRELSAAVTSGWVSSPPQGECDPYAVRAQSS
jgi:hypothetical protein